MRSIIEIDVKSSAISVIGYDEESRELYVRFRGGAYTYLDVPAEDWVALWRSRSPRARSSTE